MFLTSNRERHLKSLTFIIVIIVSLNKVEKGPKGEHLSSFDSQSFVNILMKIRDQLDDIGQHAIK